MLVKKLLMIIILSSPALVYAQTCKLTSIPSSTPSNQFTDNHNGTVKDNKTGLIWKKCSEGQVWNNATGRCNGNATTYTWQDALKQAQTVNNSSGFAGYADWHLPNITELESIVERQCYDPAINLTIFPDTPSSSDYWSSSPRANVSYNAWGISFDSGGGGWANKNSSVNVRLVRGE